MFGNKSKISKVVKVNGDGSVMLPDEVRKEYGINPGDEIALLGDNKGLALVKNDGLVKLIKSGGAI